VLSFVAVDITKMISELRFPTDGSLHFFRYKYHHLVLPTSEDIPPSTYPVQSFIQCMSAGVDQLVAH